MNKLEHKPKHAKELFSKTMYAWYEFADESYHHIYNRRFLVEVCSPDGFKQATKRKEGKIVKVHIVPDFGSFLC